MLSNDMIVKEKNTYLKSIMTLAIPFIIQGTVSQIQTLINRGFLGNLKSEYLSAIGNTIFPYNATVAVLLAVSTGVTVTIAHKTGAKKTNEIKAFFTTAIFYNYLLCMAILLFWNIFAHSIFSFMGVDSSLIGYCTSYVKILSIYLFTYGIDMSIQSMLQGIGLTKPIMYAGICKVVLNIFLDWVLIFGHLGFSAKGVYGAAISTASSNIFATLLLITYVFTSKKLPYKFKIADFLKPKFIRYKEMAKIGIPTGTETFIWYIGNLTLIRMLNSLNYLAVGIYTLTYGIEMVVYVIYNGMSKAALTLIGHKIGEKDENGAKAILTTVIKYDLAIISVISTLFILFSKHILGIFSSDPELVKKAAFYFIFTAITLFPKSINVVVGSGIRGRGDTKWMLYTQIVGTFMVVFLSMITIFVLKFDILGIYITIFVDESVRAVLNLNHFYNSKVYNRIT